MAEVVDSVFLNEEEQLVLDAPVERWTAGNLVLWLDRKLKQIDISQGELLKWLRSLNHPDQATRY